MSPDLEYFVACMIHESLRALDVPDQHWTQEHLHRKSLYIAQSLPRNLNVNQHNCHFTLAPLFIRLTS